MWLHKDDGLFRKIIIVCSRLQLWETHKLLSKTCWFYDKMLQGVLIPKFIPSPLNSCVWKPIQFSQIFSNVCINTLFSPCIMFLRWTCLNKLNTKRLVDGESVQPPWA